MEFGVWIGIGVTIAAICGGWWFVRWRRPISQLMWAVQKNQLDRAERVLRNGLPVDTPGDFGFTALTIAALGKRREMVDLLLSHGAQPTGRIFGMPVLVGAADEREPRIVEALLRAGADPNQPGDRNESALGKAIYAKDLTTINVLLRYGADPNRAFDDYVLPMSAAIASREPEIVRALLAAGAAPNPPRPQSSFLVDAMHEALEEAQTIQREPAWLLETLSALIEAGADVDALLEDAVRPLHWAIHHVYLQTVRMLLEAGAKPWHRSDDDYDAWDLAESSPSEEIRDALGPRPVAPW